MKTYAKHILAVAFMFLLQGVAWADGFIRFNDDWRFTESDSPDYRLTTYSTDSWRKLDLPHDWSIEHNFSKDLVGGTAFMPGGIGWYSKVFKTPNTRDEKCYIILMESTTTLSSGSMVSKSEIIHSDMLRYTTT
ncbi:MAG: hypothetical protein SNH01_07465 [Rikenellaceae bacterium]